MAWLKTLIEFGDMAMLVPLAAVILLWLLLVRSPRAATSWVIAVGFCTVLTALLKIVLYQCPPASDLHAPSGHTGLSTLVYGAMALVSTAESAGVRRMITIGGGAGFILAIAVSHLLIYARSGPEVALGLLTGLASLAVFGYGYLRYRAARVWLLPLLMAGGMMALILHGQQLDVESILFGINKHFQIGCPAP